MKHRDRVIAALNHEEPDRCPMQISCTPEFAEMQAVSDPHPPAQFRVNGTLANFAPLVKAFATMGVTDESPIMLPVDKRCQLW